MGTVFVRFVSDLWESVRMRLLVAMALATLIMVTEGFGILLLLPLLSAIGLTDGATGRLSMAVDEILRVLGVTPSLGILLMIFLGVVIGKSVLQRLAAVNSESVTQDFLHGLRMRLYSAYLNARYEFVTRVRGTDFIHALSDETKRVGAATIQVVNLSAQLAVSVVYLLIAMTLSWQATSLALVCGGGIFALLWYRTRVSGEAGQRLTSYVSGLESEAAQDLAGIREARCYDLLDECRQQFEVGSHGVSESSMAATRNYADVHMMFQILASLLAALIIYVSVSRFELGSAELLVLIVVFARLVPRFSSIQYGIHDLAHALPAYERVMQLAREAERCAEPVTDLSRVDLPDGDIDFDRVAFAYEGRPDGLSELTFRIPVGRTTALVGPSGAGKSTVVALLVGLLTPGSGRILVGGKVLDRSSVADWRTRIGYISQESFIRHASIRANLNWVCKSAGDDEIWEALSLAQADEFVRRLPDGLDTVVGDQGIQLSGGERQRLVLARALLRRPRVLVLDEATSALDQDNEAAIFRAIEALHGELTVLIVTHRMSSLAAVDVLIHIKEGRVVTAAP